MNIFRRNSSATKTTLLRTRVRTATTGERSGSAARVSRPPRRRQASRRRRLPRKRQGDPRPHPPPLPRLSRLSRPPWPSRPRHPRGDTRATVSDHLPHHPPIRAIKYLPRQISCTTRLPPVKHPPSRCNFPRLSIS